MTYPASVFSVGSSHVSGRTFVGPFPVDVEAMLSDAVTYLLEVNVYPFGNTSVAFAGVGTAPVGQHPVAGRSQTLAFTLAEVTIRFSDNVFITQPTDTVSAKPYMARLESMQLRRSITLSPESYSEGDQSGTAMLTNGNDFMAQFIETDSPEGRQCRILVGPKSRYASYDDDFTCIFVGVVNKWHNDGDKATIEFADNSYLLDIPLQTNTYGGTGGYDGTADILNLQKPLGYGNVSNATPICIDPTNRIYQLHDGTIYSIDNVYEAGLVIPISGDTSNLYVGSTTPGQARTDLSRGLFQLGSSPTGDITADFKGDANSTYGGYVHNVPQIVQRILRSRGGWDDGKIDAGSFASLATSVSGDAGWFWRQPTGSVREALKTLCTGMGAYWFLRRDGRIKVQRLTAPDITSITQNFTAGNVLDAKEIQMPDAIYPPTYRRRVGYGKNWTVQSGKTLSATVTDVRRQYLAEEYRVSIDEDLTVKTKWLRAKDPDIVQSAFVNEADANAMAVVLMSLHGTYRQLIQQTIGTVGNGMEMGETVSLTWPKFGLSGGKLFRFFPIQEDFQERTVTGIIWG